MVGASTSSPPHGALPGAANEGARTPRHPAQAGAEQAALEEALGAARSELESARSELGFARAELDAVRARLSDEETQRRRLQQGVDALRKEHKRREEVAVGEARRAAEEEVIGVKIREAEAVRGLDEERRAGAAAERRAGRLEGRMKGLEEELETAGRRARLREEDLRDLDARLQVCVCMYIYIVGRGGSRGWGVGW